jgi:hypothetical protein
MAEIYAAMYLFSACEIGINLPASAMTQFNAGKPWDVVPDDGGIEGGHDIPLVCKRSNMACVTWAKLQQMTLAFFQKYCEEAWIILSTEFLNNGVSPEGLNLTQLQADLANIQNTPPVPTPSPILTYVVLGGTIPTLTVGIPFDLKSLTVLGEDQNRQPMVLIGTPAWEAINVTGLTTEATISGSVVTPVLPGGIMIRCKVANIESTTLGANIIAADPTKQIIFQVGNPIVQAFGKPVTMDTAPTDVNGRVMIPARFDAEVRGDTVAWDQATQTVTITPV